MKEISIVCIVQSSLFRFLHSAIVSYLYHTFAALFSLSQLSHRRTVRCNYTLTWTNQPRRERMETVPAVHTALLYTASYVGEMRYFNAINLAAAAAAVCASLGRI